MKLLFQISVLFILGYGWFTSSEPKGIDFGPYQQCLTELSETDAYFRRVIPTGVFHMDRNLVRTSQRVPLMFQNLEILDERIKNAHQKYDVHLVENATESCWKLKSDLHTQAHSLFLFSWALALTFAASILRTFTRLLLSRSPKGKPHEMQSPQDKPSSRTGSDRH